MEKEDWAMSVFWQGFIVGSAFMVIFGSAALVVISLWIYKRAQDGNKTILEHAKAVSTKIEQETNRNR